MTETVENTRVHESQEESQTLLHVSEIPRNSPGDQTILNFSVIAVKTRKSHNEWHI